MVTTPLESLIAYSQAKKSLDIALEEFDHRLDTERLYINVHTLYRDFSGDREPADVPALFAGMARVEARRERS